MTKRGKDKGRTKIRGIHELSCIVAVKIGLATGLRRGEIFALTWDDVDLSSGIIHVTHSLTCKNERKKPKTKSGNRTVAIDPKTTACLRKWKERQLSELTKVFVKQSKDSPICCSDTGSFYRVDNFTHWWSVWRNANGFESLRFHELRHTQATMLLSNGVDVKTVQNRLGHASPNITLGWYAHAVPEKDREAADMLGALLGETE